MKVVKTVVGLFDRDIACDFIDRFNKCNGKTFRFNGRDYLRDFAKYLVEYLHTQFDDLPPANIQTKGK